MGKQSEKSMNEKMTIPSFDDFATALGLDLNWSDKKNEKEQEIHEEVFCAETSVSSLEEPYKEELVLIEDAYRVEKATIDSPEPTDKSHGRKGLKRNARHGLIWAEILQKPISKRRR